MTEIFATGIQMGESPRWHDARFWMCDWLVSCGHVSAMCPSTATASAVDHAPEGLPGWSREAIRLCGPQVSGLGPLASHRPRGRATVAVGLGLCKATARR